MLTEEGLVPVLEAGWYRDILEMTCLQCEPDSADYIRVSSWYRLARTLVAYMHVHCVGFVFYSRYITLCMTALRKKVPMTVSVPRGILEVWYGTWSSRRRLWGS